MKKILKPLSFFLLAAAVSACATNTAQKDPATTAVTPLGEVLTTPEGLTLYTFSKDSQGISNCNGGCAEKWPPYIANTEMAVGDDYSVIRRSNGDKQWTYKGMPLYRWIKDQKTGDISGHGIKNIWFIARADDVPVKIYRNAEISVLTDLNQRSLYAFDKDDQGQSNCYGKCAEIWPPLFAAKGAKKSGAFDITERKDGTLQWTLDGHPLYTWVKDQKAGDITGDGVKGIWHVIKQP
ncbi:hypothetical protein [Amphritea sp. HPY]|uniref:hypothetical protein n=1 Tax=Amphritea sp. HPY TaxID=3421652 RepID=UPI003D7D6A23